MILCVSCGFDHGLSKNITHPCLLKCTEVFRLDPTSHEAHRAPRVTCQSNEATGKLWCNTPFDMEPLQRSLYTAVGQGNEAKAP